jgi:hypothetical protein
MGRRGQRSAPFGDDAFSLRGVAQTRKSSRRLKSAQRPAGATWRPTPESPGTVRVGNSTPRPFNGIRNGRRSEPSVPEQRAE